MESRRLCVKLVMFVSLCVCSQIALGQPAADLGRSTGAPTSIYHGTDLEQVDTSSGNLHVSLPLLHLPGRGLDMDIVLSYNSKVWQSFYTPSPDGGITPPQVLAAYDQNIASMGALSGARGIGSPGWSVGVPRMGIVVGEPDECVHQDTNGNCTYQIYHSTFLANDGTRISLVNENSTGIPSTLPLWSFDGSFALLTAKGLIYKDGVTATQTTLTNTNGNSMTCSFSGTGNLTSCVDTLNRQVSFSADPVTGLPGTMTYFDSSGTSRSVTFQYSAFTLNYPYRDGNVCVDGGANPKSTYMLTRVTLANNLHYDFQYVANSDGSTTGEITKITLPTGGYIRYEYGFGPLSTDGNLNSCVFQGNAQNRMVINRFVSPDGNSSTEQKWSYAAAFDASYKTTVTDPLGNSQTYSRSFGSPLPFQTDYKDSSGKIIRSVRNEIESSSDTTRYFYSRASYQNARAKSTTIVLSDTNQQSKTTFAYTAFNNVSEKDETDWGPGAPGPIIRKSTLSYWNDFNTAYAGDTVHILNRIKDQSTCDAASTFCSQSTTSYDTTAIASTANNPVTQHDYTNYPYTNTFRGNPTQISRVLNTGGNVISTNTYNDVGNLITVTDPNSNVTTFSYADNFANGSSTQPTAAYVTQITRPVTNGVNHIQRSQYYFNTGLTAASCGENFPSGTTCAFGLTGLQPDYQSMTYDLMGRPLVATKGDGGQTTLTYNEASLPINTGSRTKIDGSHDLTQTTVYDGLGRLSQAQLTSDPLGTTYQLITYDSVGRKSQVFNPTRCNPPGTNCGEATWGYTSFAYDALGRAIVTTSQDGGLMKTKFTGNATLVTDQAGKQRQDVSDGLGRIIEVDEPGTQPPPQSNHATLDTTGNFVLANSANTILWSTGTGGTNAASIFMQDDGNLVAYIFKWQAGVYAAPSPGPFPSSSCSIGTYLVAGEILPSGKCIVSPHGQYFLLMNTDGNFFIYDWAHGTGTWGPGTQGHPGAYAIFQTDGNLVVYDVNGTALWNSGTSGTYAERLNLEDDGRIIIWKSAWNSGTSTGQFNWNQLTHPSCDVGIGTGTTGVLASGQCFVSPNGHFELLLQTDGNLVIYDLAATPPNALWSTGTGVTPLSPGYSFVTKYFYDGLSNLTCVEQHGDATSGTGCSAAPSSDATSPWRVRRFTYDSLSRLLTAKNPESGTISYAYDNDGNLLQKTSPAPNQTGTATQTVSYCYDELHRVTGKGYGAQSCPLATPVVTYAYDSGTNAKGHLTSLIDQAGTAQAGATYTYDIMGRLATETRTLKGANDAAISKTVSYEYNLDGSLYKLHYPSGAVVTYTPDAAGRTLSAVDSGSGINYVTGATYGPDNSLTGFVSGSGGAAAITNSFTYNKRLQPLTMSATTASQTVYSIGYDFRLGNGDNGNVFGITNYKDQNRNQTFTYDALNRLISAQNAGTNCATMVLQNKTEYWGNSYGYDAWGNLLQKNVTKCGAEGLTVTADAHNWIHASGTDYQYDAAGNMTFNATPPTQTYTYDQENRLTGAAGYTYTYDADGNRVRKSNGNLAANGTLYWYMTPGVVAESDLAGTLKSEYVFFNGERVARRDGATGTGGVFYYFSDHLKTASVIADSAGVIKAESDYYPWGGELQFVANDSNDYKFTGKKRDTETGLDYFGARYYSHGLGRFVSSDWSATPVPVPYADLTDPQSLNLYTYVRNIPTTRFDGDGHIPQLGKEFLQTLARAADEIANNPRQAWRDAKQSTASFVQNVVNLLPVGDNKPTNPNYQSPAPQLPPSTSAVGRLTTGGLAAGTAAIPGPKSAGAVVEDANLGVRAAEIHGALDPIAQNMRTTAVANVTNGDGTVSTLVSSSNNTLAPVQRAVLQPGETAVSGAGHAEETILNAAQKNGQTVNTMGVSRTPCPSCAQKLKDANVDVQGPR